MQGDESDSLTPTALATRAHEYAVQALNQQDLDRNFGLATWQILKWMQAARMELPWMQPGYRGLSLLEPQMTRRMLVGSQMVRVVKPGALSDAVNNAVRTYCEVGAVGQTSVEFRYKIFFGEHIVATATTTMIVASGTPGNFRPSPVPEAVRALAADDEGADRTFLSDGLARVPKEAPRNAYSHAVLVRFSDEDMNKHANHSALARFFEDAKEDISFDEAANSTLRRLAEMRLAAIQIAYIAEIRALDSLVVKVSPAERGSCLHLWAYRKNTNRFGGKEGLVARGCIVCEETLPRIGEPRPSSKL